MRELWSSLFRLDPLTAPAWPRAVRAAIALGLPVAIAALLGVPHLGYTAAVGSFAALYGGTLPARERAKAVPFVAAGLIAGMRPFGGSTMIEVGTLPSMV